MKKKNSGKKKIVLAFSGGLDTCFVAKYLSDKGYEVHSLFLYSGSGNTDELKHIEMLAGDMGVKSHRTINISKDYYRNCIRYLVAGNVLRNGNYPLSVSSERYFQAAQVARYAGEIGADGVAHGSTGAGNDQVRFDTVISVLAPGLEIFAPVRDNKLTREEEIAYLQDKGVELNQEDHKYSLNEGLWGTSIGGDETLTSHRPIQDTSGPDKKADRELTLIFEQGECVGINQSKFNDPVEAIEALNKIGKEYGIGMDYHTGDTIIGEKGRIAFQAPAALMIIKSHHLLEKHTLTKHQLQWKNHIADWYGNMLHEGLYMEPAMRDAERFLESSQQYVTGEVYLLLREKDFKLQGIQSPYDLMEASNHQYGEKYTEWDAEDVKGFIKIYSNSLKNYYGLHTDLISHEYSK
ncbi:MAG: argininosuccinate synthase domain-containing protein [Bacteroidales bacterium]|nr:argininosuccinate synthase [Bacteroidales bacterium]